MNLLLTVNNWERLAWWIQVLITIQISLRKREISKRHLTAPNQMKVGTALMFIPYPASDRFDGASLPQLLATFLLLKFPTLMLPVIVTKLHSSLSSNMTLKVFPFKWSLAALWHWHLKRTSSAGKSAGKATQWRQHCLILCPTLSHRVSNLISLSHA